MGTVADGLTWLMDQVGFAICHQLSERTIAYGSRVMPVCARDTGIFLGFAACFIALLLAYGRKPRRYPTWPKLLVLALFILPTALDAVTSYAGLRESGNLIRLATGSLAGTGLAALVFPLAVSSTEPDNGTEERLLAFGSWWSVALLLCIPVAVTLLVQPDWPGAYWFWAPAVTLSIVFTLFVLNFTLIALAAVWIRGEHRVPGPAPLAGIALAAALLEIVVSNRLHWAVQSLFS
jgi:uncharacterized membrane protein